MTTATDPAPAVERTRWATIAAVGFAQLVVAGGMSALAVALPPIRTDLGVSESATAWVLLSYALPMGAVAIAAGRLADRADLRAVAVASLSGLGLFSVLAAVAPTFGVLVAARVAQGLVGGFLFGMTGRIIVTSATARQRGRAMSALVLMMTVGGMGMVGAGGLIVAAWDWRGLFWVFAVLAGLAVAGLAATVPSNGTGLPRLDRDIVGEIATSGGAIVAFLLVFEFVDTVPAVSAAALALSAGLVVLWVRRPSSAATVRLLRRRSMAGALLSLTLLSAVTGLMNFSLPFWLTDVRGLPAELVSSVLLAFIGGVAVTTPLSGFLADRFGPGPVALAGGVLVLVAFVPLPLVDTSTGLLGMVVRIAGLGLAFGLFNAPMNTYLLASAPAEQSGTAGAFMATTRTIGSSLGPVIAALAWGLGASAHEGYRLSALAVGALLVSGVVAMAAGRPWRGGASAP